MKTITKNQYYQLIGLKTLAEEYDKRLRDLQDCVVGIVNEVDVDGQPIRDAGGGWSGEFIFSTYLEVHGFLDRLEITVED